MTWMLFGWGLLGWSLVILSVVATAKLLTVGEVGFRVELRRLCEPIRRTWQEWTKLRQVRRTARMMCDCERRYKGAALG